MRSIEAQLLTPPRRWAQAAGYGVSQFATPNSKSVLCPDPTADFQGFPRAEHEPPDASYKALWHCCRGAFLLDRD
jgi:hypothetical protein